METDFRLPPLQAVTLPTPLLMAITLTDIELLRRDGGQGHDQRRQRRRAAHDAAAIRAVRALRRAFSASRAASASSISSPLRTRRAELKITIRPLTM